MNAKMFAAALALGALCASAEPYMPDVFKSGETILFIGDSITHGGRNADMNHYLGHGYAAEISMRYLGYRPNMKLEFANRGDSGDTSRGLVRRWGWDAFPYSASEAGYAGVFPEKPQRRMPDVVSILIGINGYFYTNKNHVAVGEYERNLRTLVEKSRAARPGVRIVLCEPFRIPVDSSPDFIARQTAVRKMATELGTAFVPFQTLFNDLLKENPNPKYWMWDVCHPTFAAHMRMADFWLEHVAADPNFRKTEAK